MRPESKLLLGDPKLWQSFVFLERLTEKSVKRKLFPETEELEKEKKDGENHEDLGAIVFPAGSSGIRSRKRSVSTSSVSSKESPPPKKFHSPPSAEFDEEEEENW